MAKRRGPWQVSPSRHGNTSLIVGWVLVFLFASGCITAWVLAGGPNGGSGQATGIGNAWLVSQGRSVRAEAVAQIGIEPSYLELSAGQVVTVQVMIYNVLNLYGFELHMGFNPSVIRIVDRDASRPGVNVTPGDFLFPDYMPVNVCDNVTGKVDAGVVQLGRAPSSGSGCLITITLEAIGPGDAAVSFNEVKLSDSDARQIDCDPLPFTLTVSGPTLTPAPTATPTTSPAPSATPTATVTQPVVTTTPTQTATATATPTSSGPTAVPTPYFYLDPQALSLSPNGTGQVIIRTSHVDDLCGVEVHLRWDPALVEVVDADPSTEGIQILPGDLFVGHNVWSLRWNSADNHAGELVYSLALNEGFNCLSGEWSVATITFHALGEGVSSLTFFDSLMASAIGEIPSGHVDGEVIVAQPSPTPTQTPTLTDTPIPSPTATPTEAATPTATATLTVPATATPTATETEEVSPTPTITATATLQPGGGCSNLIENGGFELQLNHQAPPWFLLEGATVGANLGREGSSCLWLGGYDGATDRAYQLVSLPLSATSAVLSYWWRMETHETSHPHDYLYVELLSEDGQLIATLDTRNDGDTQHSWFRSAFDVLAYAGQTIRVQFRIHNDSTAFTNFFLDDAQLDVCTGGVQMPTPTTTPTGAYALHLPLVLRN